jgi:hypothetical protein
MHCDVCDDRGSYWNNLLQEMRPCVNGCRVPPGIWFCPTCQYQLEQCNLDPTTMVVTPRDGPGSDCPNCKTPLQRN